MSGKRPYSGSIYTLPLTAAAYGATQLETWTRDVRGRMRRGRRPTGFPGRRGPGRSRRPTNRRRPRRPTRTGTRLKKKFHQSATLSGDGSFSSFSHGFKMLPFYSKGVYKTTRRNVYITNGSYRQTCGIGKQNVLCPFAAFTNADCNAMYSTISGVTPTTRMCFLSASAELSFTNQDQAAVKIQIYDLICRRDTNTDAASFWAYGDTDEGDTSAEQVVGALPFSSDTLCQYWKVCKCTHLTLEQGKNHVHRIRYTPNKVMSKEVINNSTGAFISRFSIGVLVVIHGLPTNDATTKTTVSTGACAVDMVYKKQYRYTWVSDTNVSMSGANNLTTSFPGGQDNVNIGTGEVSTNMQA